MKTTTHRRTNDHRPSSAERAKLRLKLALEYGNGERREHTVKVRCGTGANRGYRIDSFNVGIDIYCHLCEAPLHIDKARATDGHYVELDRIEAGGRYVAENLLPACRHCNASRGDAEIPASHVERYRAQYGRNGKMLRDGRCA